MTQRLRFSDSLERMPGSVLDQLVHFLERFGIRPLPVEIVLPSLLGESEFYVADTSDRFRPFSDSSD